MAAVHNREIAQMGWDALEARLQTSTRGTTHGSADEQALKEYFGEAEYHYVQQLAEQAHVLRSRTSILGNVVLLPGIMGSYLTTVASSGDEDLIWVSLGRLALGRLERLQLTPPDGSKGVNPAFQVKATGIDKRTYTRAMLWLRTRWHVEAFPYDWRQDIGYAADALATFIGRTFGEQPVHLVAHSLGGLVARSFICRHHELWRRMRQNDQSQGGRLIMLGTPNFGSFAISQALTGIEPLVRLLAAADVVHNLTELLDILNTFVGTYQMLPAPSKIPAPMQAIYRQQSWGLPSVLQQHLDRALQFHSELEKPETIDPERMIYIAGSGQETLAGLSIVTPGEFDYTITHDGDGRVPYALGLLPDVPTYYVNASHGDLLRDERVLMALDELLTRGSTVSLAVHPPRARTLAVDGTHWRRSIDEQHISNEVEDIAQRAKQDMAGPDEVRRVEETLMRASMGQAQATKPLARVEERTKRSKAPGRMPLRVEVVLGDITYVEAPIVVVGHYKGIPPVRAEGAIDEALGFWISRIGARGMIGAGLGELFFVPVNNHQIAAKAVLLAGMGEPGQFSRNDLRYLSTNVAYAIAALGHDRFASVVIGSGEGNLPKEGALRAMLRGVGDAQTRLNAQERLQQVILIEYDEAYYKDMADIVQRLAKDNPIPELQIDVSLQKLPAQKRGRRRAKERPVDLPATPLPGTRITVERDRDVFSFSALSETAVIPVRQVAVQAHFATGATERLMRSHTQEEQERYGQLLYTYLIPEDFRRVIDDEKPLTLILDRSTAAFPWEMAGFRGTRGPIFFGPHLRLTRQFRTLLSTAPGVAPPLNSTLKVLVIADPAREPELQLPGARQEGREVVTVLNHFKRRSSKSSSASGRWSVIRWKFSRFCSPTNSISCTSPAMGSLTKRSLPAVDGFLAKTAPYRPWKFSGPAACRVLSSPMRAFPRW
jgi:pimeloyl-ACP methyl ester carboxylesterase